MPLGARTGENPRAEMTRNLARKGHAFLRLCLFDAHRFCRQPLLLTFLCEGQEATVLQLPAKPTNNEEARAQERVAFAG